MGTKISQHRYDLIQKRTCALLREIMPDFYGIKVGRVKEVISAELPNIEVSGGGSDMVLLSTLALKQERNREI